MLNTKLVNHADIKREAKTFPEGRVTFELSRSVDTKWKAQVAAKNSQVYWGLLLDLAKVRESSTLRVVVKLEYSSNQNQLVPECPYIYLTRPLRLHQDKLVRIL